MAVGAITGGLLAASTIAPFAYELLVGRPGRRTQSEQEDYMNRIAQFQSRSELQFLQDESTRVEGLRRMSEAFSRREAGQPAPFTSIERNQAVNTILAQHREKLAMSSIPSRETAAERAAARYLGVL